jgi:hypothetical protein
VESLSTQTITSFRELRQTKYRTFAQAGTALAIIEEKSREKAALISAKNKKRIRPSPRPPSSEEEI